MKQNTMNMMKSMNQKTFKKIFEKTIKQNLCAAKIMAVFLFALFVIFGQTVGAKELPVITVHNGEAIPVNANVADTGKIVADSGVVQVDHYVFTDMQKNFNAQGQDITEPYYNYNNDNFNDYGDSDYTDDDSSDSVVACNEDGTFTINHKGIATIYVYGFNAQNIKVFDATVTVTATYDMTEVTVSTAPIRLHCSPSSLDEKGKACYLGTTISTELAVTSPFALGEDMDMTCTSSTSKYSAQANVTEGKLYLSVNGCKSATFNVTLAIEGKQFVIPITVARVTINTNSYLLPKKKAKQLKITNYKGQITWTSTNKKIATVSSTGKVKGKKYGNCVIIAKLDNGTCLGCAVSVTTPKLRKVCARAEYIGRNWKYSQPKRTQVGYYDCSALVWKAYMYGAKLSFGNATYPGTTGTESAWCKAHGRMIKGGYKAKKLSKLEVNPGDIIFKSSNMKNKYGTTTHVEMFTGYTCFSVSDDGTPTVGVRFGARNSWYAGTLENKSLFARPLKY